ncbi:MAG TPA: polymer-forming cytoskeletal protein [Humidesulfovibrio sp.]|uniref:polymer-forming cytoskeletal protein n=1 Tax=Humidesulfovibrio sp. TaxID=2910988 RepID=UPI002C7DC7DA|nr:polymer-forming cytoskeletal protein [Humidesulfovibrio sp.]HWR04704.1 polymer-forming cytoskeletal protein [Humidesulfovibrio sp.]
MQHLTRPMRGDSVHRQRGSVALYLALALVAFGVLAAAGATRFSSTVQGVFQPNCITQARYMSESGMRYAMARLRACADATAVNAAVAAMNGKTFTVDADKGLSFTLSVSYASGSATVSSTGASCSKPGSSASAFTGSATVNLPAISSGGSAANSPSLQGTYSGTSAVLAGNSSGNVTTTTTTLQGGSTVDGALTYMGTTSCLNLTGGVSIGTPGGSYSVCSNSCVTVDGGSYVYGNIYSQGNVTVTSGVVAGNIYSNGAVTITSGTVQGNVYSQGSVSVTGAVTGNIYSGGNVSLGWGSNVSGNIFCTGTYSAPAWFTGYSGKVTTGYPKSSIPAAKACTSYALPAHKTVASTQARVISGNQTFYGTSNLADTSNAYTSISTSGWPSICFDLSTPGTYINIFCSGNMSVSGDLYVRTSTATSCFDPSNKVTSTQFAGSAAASRVYMDVQGSVSFGGGTNWFGTVYAGGNIYPGGGGSYIGAFYTNQSFNPGSQWIYTRYVGSNYVATYWP